MALCPVTAQPFLGGHPLRGLRLSLVFTLLPLLRSVQIDRGHSEGPPWSEGAHARRTCSRRTKTTLALRGPGVCLLSLQQTQKRRSKPKLNTTIWKIEVEKRAWGRGSEGALAWHRLGLGSTPAPGKHLSGIRPVNRLPRIRSCCLHSPGTERLGRWL